MRSISEKRKRNIGKADTRRRLVVVVVVVGL